MSTSGSGLDGARRLVLERGLVRAAFEHLTVDAFLDLPFEAVGPTKALLKRFFSTDPWGSADDEALAAAVGPGEGTWRHHLDAEVSLDLGWVDGRFGVRVSTTTPQAPAAAVDPGPAAATDHSLDGTFDGPVVPEATPNPRSIRFQVGAIDIEEGPAGGGPRRWYESAAAAGGDPGAARLFAGFEEVANVLVGPDFVAVGLHRAADWERLLRPILDLVTDEFADPDRPPEDPGRPRVTGGPAGAGRPSASPPASPSTTPPAGGGDRRPGRLQRAWDDLGALRPGASADDLARVRDAASDDDPARRQVAARLLDEADPQVAVTEWARMVLDPVRSVRRATVDTMVDTGRPALRPLLEQALVDTDAWVRWKAIRGLAELGAGPSREPIARLSGDADFRIRLEVAAALRQAQT